MKPAHTLPVQQVDLRNAVDASLLKVNGETDHNKLLAAAMELPQNMYKVGNFNVSC